jgi:hypothetical protein
MSPSVEDRDAGAVPGELGAGRPADIGRAARDEGDAIGQRKFHGDI